ncbi:hypothetical protein RFI_27663, partial [Reticulomyxa filosa]
GGNTVITQQLEKKLREVIENAPKCDTNTLNMILESYYQLNEIGSLNKVLESTVCDVLEIICTKVICRQLEFSDNYAQKQGTHYKKLCKQLKVELFMECFMNICGRVFDILYCYYKIESSIIKFRHSKQINVEDMQLLRKSLWRKTQGLLGDLLETSQFSSRTKIKMEDLLLALHGAEVFRLIGQSFSGSESADLENSIRGKCRQYLDHFRKNFFESMKSTFDNEMWVVLPIPKNFGVNDIKELQKSPHLVQSFQTKNYSTSAASFTPVSTAAPSSVSSLSSSSSSSSTPPPSLAIAKVMSQNGVEKKEEKEEKNSNAEEDEKTPSSQVNVDGATQKKDNNNNSEEEKGSTGKSGSEVEDTNGAKSKVVENGSIVQPTVATSKTHPHVYQQFLSGENIFDQLLKNKQESEQMASGQIELDGANDADTREESKKSFEKPLIAKPNDDGSEPVLTSASLNVAKHLGRCLQVMECLDPVAFEAFQALRESFYFYLYHVFVWFGVNVQHFFDSTNKYSSPLDALSDSSNTANSAEASGGMNAGNNMGGVSGNAASGIAGANAAAMGSLLGTSSQKKYPVLTKIINMVNEQLLSRTLAPDLEDLIKKKFNGPVRRPKKLPAYAKLLMEASEGLDLETDSTMQGVAYRFVATETLTFLIEVIDTVRHRLFLNLSKNQHHHVQELVDNARQVVQEFKTYMYRNVPTLLVHLGSPTDKESISYDIKQARWNRKDLSSEPSAYVTKLLSMFAQVEEVLSSHPTLPKFIHHKLNTEAIIYVQEQL